MSDRGLDRTSFSISAILSAEILGETIFGNHDVQLDHQTVWDVAYTYIYGLYNVVVQA